MPSESGDVTHVCRRCPHQFRSVSAHAIESVPNFKQRCGRLLAHSHIVLPFFTERHTIDLSERRLSIQHFFQRRLPQRNHSIGHGPISDF